MLAIFDGYIPLECDGLSSVTKLGGRPAFMKALATAPVADATAAGMTAPKLLERDAVCGRCKQPLYLLSQSFCPLREATNRMMYVFCCNSAACAPFPEESWACFTVQVDSEDADAANDEEDDPALRRVDPPVKGQPPYDATAVGPGAFPPVATDIVEEPLKEHIELSEEEEELKRRIENQDEETAQRARADLEELEQNVDLRNKTTDVYYEKFRRRVARAPSQVLRYQRNGFPIFMDPEQTIYVTIPPCSDCGGKMCMELQVMPTALYFVHSSDFVDRRPAVGRTSGDDGVDFATATVYTCAQGCRASLAGVRVKREFVFVEPPPSLASEEEQRAGKMAFREMVSGTGVGPLAAGLGAPSTVEDVAE